MTLKPSYFASMFESEVQVEMACQGRQGQNPSRSVAIADVKRDWSNETPEAMEQITDEEWAAIEEGTLE